MAQIVTTHPLLDNHLHEISTIQVPINLKLINIKQPVPFNLYVGIDMVDWLNISAIYKYILLGIVLDLKVFFIIWLVFNRI